ncbi:hypothetical protein A2U01_0075745 [Trifolium medium]|uniref:Uncharacterized protein n=1 Tax=Trifolium medium TaxID=97028 RepID=A0A392T2G3_9FABA|nr:hypothetical protein [Trifolium medium]
MASLIATDDTLPCTTVSTLTVPSRQTGSVIQHHAGLQLKESMSLLLYATNVFCISNSSTIVGGEKKVEVQQSTY